ncbi:unnamed protein product [Schistosoma margrebowiei]|uniref:WD_REPEATS_REGION domain-containing protein n=1 Tax=Schistosoma margrebowiei TaxID=48269 RepID=A0AA85AJL5_9TREM|nr:unnamed protein product [Schistosoma margrebowiei]
MSTPRDSFFMDQCMYLAAVQNSSVHFWSIRYDKNIFGSSNSDYRNLEIPDSPSLTYKPQMTVSCSLRSIQWEPRSCKLAVIDNSGSTIFFRRLYTGKNHVYDQNASDITTFSLLSHSFTATCIAFPQRSGRYLAVGTSAGPINLYKCQKQISFYSQLRFSNNCESLSSNEVQPRCVSWVLKDRVVVAGYSNGYIVLFLAASGTSTGECEHFILPFPSYANNNSPSTPACNIFRTYTESSDLLCCGYSDGSIIFWRLDWPIVRHTQELIFCRWDPTSFLPTSINTNNCEYCMDIALSTGRRLFTAGAPDMNLRMWDASILKLIPIKTLSPIDEQHGYLSVDVTLDTSILATGLANGNIWFYNILDFTSPIRCVSSGSDVPISLLSFSFAYRTSDEVKFSSPKSNKLESLQDENLDAKLYGNSTSVQSTVTDTLLSLSKQPLHEITNVIPKCQPDTWVSLFREFSVPDISLHSNSSMFPSSDQGSIKSSWSEVNIDNIEKMVSLRPESNIDVNVVNINQQLKSDYHHNKDVVNLNSVNITNEWLEQYFNVKLQSMMSELNWSHNELLFKFTKLECKLDQMCKEFHNIINQIKHENNLLRYTLNQYTQF